jgi:hypothetical protein
VSIDADPTMFRVVRGSAPDDEVAAAVVALVTALADDGSSATEREPRSSWRPGAFPTPGSWTAP